MGQAQPGLDMQAWACWPSRCTLPCADPCPICGALACAPARQGSPAGLQRLRGRRLARVVAWLEHRAGEALDRAEAAAQRSGGSGARFARDEGVPLSTLRALGRPGAAGLVSELDPDAPTRCAASA